MPTNLVKLLLFKAIFDLFDVRHASATF